MAKQQIDYASHLKYYQDFPTEGVNFVDIIPFLQDKALLKDLTKELGALCDSPNIAAPEARGFLFASPMLTTCRKVSSAVLTARLWKL